MDWLAFLNVAFGLIALIAGGISTGLLGTVRTLKESNEALKSRADEQRQELSDLRAALALRTQQRDAFESAVRGDEKLDEMQLLLTRLIAHGETHHRKAIGHWDIEIEILRQIRDLMTSPMRSPQ